MSRRREGGSCGCCEVGAWRTRTPHVVADPPQDGFPPGTRRQLLDGVGQSCDTQILQDVLQVLKIDLRPFDGSASRQQHRVGDDLGRQPEMRLSYLVDVIDINPVKLFLKRHIREAPPRTTYPSAEQVDYLIANASPTAGHIIRFLTETGMRQEEVCGLEWSQGSIQRRESG